MFSLENLPRDEWDGEEMRVYDRVRLLLEETDLDLNAGGPLTPKLADMWGDLLANTWVWGSECSLGFRLTSFLTPKQLPRLWATA